MSHASPLGTHIWTSSELKQNKNSIKSAVTFYKHLSFMIRLGIIKLLNDIQTCLQRIVWIQIIVTTVEISKVRTNCKEYNPNVLVSA